MAITMRIGLEKDFIPERMHTGELAISTDTGLMRYCHGPNKIKLIATDEDIAEMRKMVSDFDLTVQQALADIGNLGQSQTQRVNTAGNTQTTRVNTVGDTQVTRIQAEGTTQVKNVQAAAAEISADREQIHTNRDNTAQLQRTTASAIIREAAGSFLTLEDAAEGKGYRKLDVQGMTVQDGVPAPDAEVPLKNVGVLNPETGKYEVKVTACKNNLLDMTGAKGGTAAGITTIVNPDGTLTSNGTGTGAPVAVWLLGKYTADITGDNVLMVLQAGKTYCISDIVLFMGTEYPAQYKFFVDPEKYPEGFKVTGVRHAQIDSGTVLTNKVYYPRVILGDKDTGWEPYKGRTATVTSDRPLTQWDKLTCRDGVWGWAYGGTVRKFTGEDNERWGAYNDIGFYIELRDMKPGNYQNDGYSNRFSCVKGPENIGKQGIWFGTDDRQYLHILQVTSIAKTVTEWKTWLSTHPLVLNYQLATEEWVPLPSAEQSAMNALCSYAGTTHIWTDDPLQPVISLEYTVDTETYISNVMGGLRISVNPDDMGLDINY
jgi:hypothetical protein|nr:MAG TPA: hypothetical protein [Caudoviricetes sp.]